MADPEMPAMMSRYRRSLLLTLGCTLACVLALNVAVDPLWHLGGNRVTGKNIGFNERLAKLNLARSQAAQADCVIYGSSRATLLNGDQVPGYRCFNMAVSEGLAQEFPLYADYLKQQGLKARLLVIGADDLSFFNPPTINHAPAWLQRGEPAPAWWRDYLSLDALQFSVRALAGKSPTPRYFREDFSIAIEPGRRHYRPDNAALIALDSAVGDAGAPARQPYADYLDFYAQLIDKHADAEVVIYVPPISLWRLGDLIRRGELPDYLDSIHALSRLGVRVLDFSVPSALSSDPERTYDGSHYNLEVNARIGTWLRAEDCGPCLPVHRLSREEYRQRFRQAYVDWRGRTLAAEAGTAN